jgi:organic hydroperoxide reductase OsmC/OhrA
MVARWADGERTADGVASAAMEPKRFEYAARLERNGALVAEGTSRLEPDETWLPEHLVLVAVAQCTLTSLRHYARSTSVEASAEVAGVVTRRDEDDLFALVEVEVLLDVRLEPEPSSEELGKLLARAERGCFVGNSLTAHPRTVWRINGRLAEAAA